MRMPNVPLHPFAYDAFQQRAIDGINRDVSLFVSAPTGAGKTALADYVIERALGGGRRVIYTAPIKALSNQKFRDFSARHGEAVGIMTGDVTINPRASLMIMTTEIYRNTLLEDPERLAAYAWIIFDEIHFLDDPERGTVWEEAILFSPPSINLLCLSATIPNVQELASWIRAVHDRPVEIVEETRRPVPLSIIFQAQDQLFTSEAELARAGFRSHAWQPARQRHAHHPHGARHLAKPNRLDTLVRDLLERERLPCLFFTFGRRRTEEIAWELSRFSLIGAEERASLRRLFDDVCARFGVARSGSIESLSQLLDRGVGYHHAGMLPAVKEIIERCFASRLMKIIVTTETFALGINMPARSVVLDSLQKRGDRGFELLRRREFLQMAGRAGRRGMDEEGFVYLRVNPAHVTAGDVAHLLHGPPEPVHSRFNTAYATLLNLYRRHGRGLLEIFPRTLYYLQTTGPRRQQGLDHMRRKLDLLEALGYLGPQGLTPRGEFGSYMYGSELLITELHAQRRLADLDPVALAVLMAALVYEPRPRMGPAPSHRLSRRLAALCREPAEHIHREEARFRISPKTKVPAFHLTRAMEAWVSRAPFDKLSKLCDVDEGEIVRYFRMAVQLLRQLAETPAADPALRATAERARQRVNRDVIDAEAQLRVGSQ